jgi:hypothetical protein
MFKHCKSYSPTGWAAKYLLFLACSPTGWAAKYLLFLDCSPTGCLADPFNLFGCLQALWQSYCGTVYRLLHSERAIKSFFLSIYSKKTPCDKISVIFFA